MCVPAPLISVVTPTKNRHELLCETMDSVQRQSFQAWEHIIVDDGSEDGTAGEVLVRAKSDPRLRYQQRATVCVSSKAGANVCRNIGIHESRSEYLIFLDSDDLLRPSCLETRFKVMDRNADLDFAVFRAGVFTHKVGDRPNLYHDQAPGDDLLRFLSLECVWQTTGAIWRRDFLERIGGFDESLLSMQDLELHVRAICGGGKYISLRTVDHDIRWQNDISKTSVRHFHDSAYIECAERARDCLFNTVRAAGLLTWSRQRAVLGQSFGLAESWLRAGRTDRAMKTWSEGCGRYDAPLHVRLFGIAMLQLLRARPNETALLFRLANKWKGWVRFRPEPNLMISADAAESPTSSFAQIEN